MSSSRTLVLAALVALLATLAAFALASVLSTVFFAITVAYVLVPLRRRLVEAGLPRRVAVAIVTLLALLAVVLVVAPVGFVLYRRRKDLFEILRRTPDTVTVAASDFEYVVETASIVASAETAIRQLAVETARAVPVLALKLILFSLLVYGMLHRPAAVREAVDRLVPPRYHDIVEAFHERTRATLYAIYVLQAATAVGTFAVALVVFGVLGYRSALALAIVAGALQFVPVVGPSILVVVLAAGDLLAGATNRAVAVLVLGLVLIGLLPDAVIRTKLAGWAAELPVSLYFIGFVGGVLTLGPIGFIAGPLLIALLVESVTLLSAGTSPGQTKQ